MSDSSLSAPEDLVATSWLKGPFSLRQNSENGFEVLNCDGQVSAWVFGEKNADFILRLLNLADQHCQVGRLIDLNQKTAATISSLSDE